MTDGDCHAPQDSHRFGSLVQNSGKEPHADPIVNPTYTTCSAAAVESGVSTGMASQDATAPSLCPAVPAEGLAPPRKPAQKQAEKTKVSPSQMLCCIMTNHRWTPACCMLRA